MSILYRLFAVFSVTIRRLFAQKGLTLAKLVGLATAVAFIVTIPLYSDAIYYRILEGELDLEQGTHRSPFIYIFSYIGSWKEPVQWDNITAVNDYMDTQVSRDLGLPAEHNVHHFETDIYQLFPAGTANYGEADSVLKLINFATTQNIENYIQFTDGRFPQPTDNAPNSTLEVAVSEHLANELGLQAGDELIAYNTRVDQQSDGQEVPIRIAGIWQAQNSFDTFWFYAPNVFNDLILITEESYINRLSPYIDDEIYLGTWYFLPDGGQVNTTNAGIFANRSVQLERKIDNILPDTLALASPVDALRDYTRSVNTLTTLLYAFNVPTVGLILTFIGLVIGISINQRRNEIAVMRSRGATPLQIILIAALEGLILGVITLLAGLGLGLLFTQLVAQVRSFLDFSIVADVRYFITPPAFRAGLYAVALAMGVQIIASISAANHTIITYKEESARNLKAPWWQRAYVDLLLLIPLIYGFNQLQQEGGLLLSVGDGGPFQNPLFFLLPAIAIFAITLLFLRLIPWIMRLFSWILGLTNSIGLLIAARQLARAPRVYAAPLILLVLTVSLSVFTSSLAQTLDLQLIDQQFYEVGSDMDLLTPGNPIDEDGEQVRVGISGAIDQDEVTAYVFVPVSEYEEIDGIEAATRVGRYQANANTGSRNTPGTFMGVDRTNFNQAAYWRQDFASSRLGTLMNTLGQTKEGVLVPNSYLQRERLQIGDFVRLDVRLYGGAVDLETQIVGSFDYFPSWYPSTDGPLFVGNLDTLFEAAGSEFPYRVWVRTDLNIDEAAFQDALDEQGLLFTTWNEPFTSIEAEQTQPQRQGLFGTLSIGFIVAALLTVLGFLLYAIFSFRQRSIELGILRAVGLSSNQMLILVAAEQAAIILSGLVLGGVLGILMSEQFVPFLQLGTDEASLVPPYLVEIAWPAIQQIIWLFGLLFLGAIVTLGLLLRRMKIFEAVKMGETV